MDHITKHIGGQPPPPQPGTTTTTNAGSGNWMVVNIDTGELFDIDELYEVKQNLYEKAEEMLERLGSIYSTPR